MAGGFPDVEGLVDFRETAISPAGFFYMNILKISAWQKLLKWLLAGGWYWLVGLLLLLFGEKIGTKFLGGSAGIILLLAAVHALMGLVLYLKRIVGCQHRSTRS